MRLANNLSLPALPFWQARSFYAQLLLAASVTLNTMGIDLMGWLAAVGIGMTPDEVVEKGVSLWQALSPILFGLLAWYERRAPNYRLTLSGGGPLEKLWFLGAAAVLGLLLAAGPSSAQSRCLPLDQAVQVLHERYGEELVGAGVDGGSMPVLLFVSPDTRSWTLLRAVAGGGVTACILVAGLDWATAVRVPPGERM